MCAGERVASEVVRKGAKTQASTDATEVGDIPGHASATNGAGEAGGPGPRRSPLHAYPADELVADFTTARMTALSPGQSPPPVRMPMRSRMAYIFYKSLRA